MVVATVALSAAAMCAVARGCHTGANYLIEQVERALLYAPCREMSDGRVAATKEIAWLSLSRVSVTPHCGQFRSSMRPCHAFFSRCGSHRGQPVVAGLIFDGACNLVNAVMS